MLENAAGTHARLQFLKAQAAGARSQQRGLML
jgi:hypothetical protein